MKKLLFIFIITGTYTGIHAEQLPQPTVTCRILNISANTVAIDPDDVCVVVTITQGTKSSTKVVCLSGKIFDRVQTKESAMLGTPGQLMYANYIGFARITPSDPKLMGSGKRMDVCIEACTNK